ncbi:YjzC family protein [Thalassorhabdus alkalitolerans]|uniref:YjzC family protein n=1 Tax=Thalassorhabdus alkalitolerans TaxID=2282697 RepID=A0ABW0YJ21_9BACI|nr:MULTISPECIES: YjzC family protein [Bacillaceae]
MATLYKTGEKAPETGTYVFDSYVNTESGNPPMENMEEIELEKEDRFPPMPTENDAVYWRKK